MKWELKHYRRNEGDNECSLVLNWDEMHDMIVTDLQNQRRKMEILQVEFKGERELVKEEGEEKEDLQCAKS